jgi:hypothetical protein
LANLKQELLGGNSRRKRDAREADIGVDSNNAMIDEKMASSAFDDLIEEGNELGVDLDKEFQILAEVTP